MAIGIGSLIGGALKVGSSIIGGIKQKKAAKRQQSRINELMQENQNWYDRAYNEDETQRADAQRLITMTQDAMRRNNQAEAGMAAVAGGTTESIAAAKAANNQAIADTVSQIAADAAGRKNAIEQQYMATKRGLIGDLNDIDTHTARQTASAVRNSAGVAAEIAGNLNDELGYIGKKR